MFQMSSDGSDAAGDNIPTAECGHHRGGHLPGRTGETEA